MKIAVFTSNQPRHISLINDLATISDDVFAVIESNTIFPGQVQDFFQKSPIMQEYFKHVIKAEKEVFEGIKFLAKNARALVLKSGDLNKLDLEIIKLALECDVLVVFGSSFIRGELCEQLVKKMAINIHIGISPYYRGNSCNFWALNDNRPDMVGATIHWLGKGLDSGDILFHALPKPVEVDPFVFGTLAVKAAHKGLTSKIKSGEIFSMKSEVQDKSKEIRYSRNADFTDEVAANYLKNKMTSNEMFQKLKNRDNNLFLRPLYY